MTQEHTTFERARQDREVAAVIKVVAEHYGYTKQVLLSAGREEPRVTARQVAMMLARELTAASYPDLARYFGKGEHETVRHACLVVPEKALTSEKLRSDLASLRLACANAIHDQITAEVSKS